MLGLGSCLILLLNKQPEIQAQTITEPAALLLTDIDFLPHTFDQDFNLNVVPGQEFNLSVYIQPNENKLSAVDVEMDFDPEVIEVLGKTNGNLFPTYIEPTDAGYLDQEQGFIALGGLAFDQASSQPTAPLTSAGEFVRFRVKVKESLGSLVSEVKFRPLQADSAPLTTDSNLVSLSGPDNEPIDVLGWVNSFKLIVNQPGDINGDSVVNLSDFFLVARNFNLNSNYIICADINRDNRVDLLDFYQIARNYNQNY